MGRRRKLTRTADALLTAGLADAVLLFVVGTTGGISCLSSAPLEWRWSWWPPGWACRDMFTGAGSPGPVSWALLLVAVVVVIGIAIVALTGRIFVSASTEAMASAFPGGSPFTVGES